MAGIHDRLKGVRSLYQGSAAGPPPANVWPEIAFKHRAED